MLEAQLSWDCDVSQGALIFKCLQGLLVSKRQ